VGARLRKKKFFLKKKKDNKGIHLLL